MPRTHLPEDYSRRKVADRYPQMLIRKRKLRQGHSPPSVPLTEGLPGGDAVGPRVPGLVLLQGWAESGVGLRVDVEGTGSLAGLSGSCTSSGHK